MKKAQKKSAVMKKPEFNVRFAAVRRERGLTLQELADKAKVHISHIQRIEAGKSQPTVEILKRLAEALSVSTDLLIFDRATEVAARRLEDKELIDQFAAVDCFNAEDKLVVKKVLAAMIIKHKLESVLPQPLRSDSTADH